jgi:hypothetical protein
MNDGLIRPQFTPEEWSELHDIEIEEVECLGCKKKFISNIPVAFKNYRGFQIAEHGCDKKYNRAHFVCVSKERNDQLNKILEPFNDK